MSNVHVPSDYAKIAMRLRNDELEFKCEGTSMNSVLKEGDKILVRRTPFDSLRFGDIITYEENGIFITHRFLHSRVHKNQIVMMIKVDNRLKLDKPVLSHFLVGKVIGILRQGKKIEIYLTD